MHAHPQGRPWLLAELDDPVQPLPEAAEGWSCRLHYRPGQGVLAGESSLAHTVELAEQRPGWWVLQVPGMEVAGELVGRVRPQPGWLLLSPSDRAVSLARARGWSALLAHPLPDTLTSLAGAGAEQGLACPLLAAHQLPPALHACTLALEAQAVAGHQQLALRSWQGWGVLARDPAAVQPWLAAPAAPAADPT